MASDYAPTPVEDFLDPDHPTLFPGSRRSRSSTWRRSAPSSRSRGGTSYGSTGSARPRSTWSRAAPSTSSTTRRRAIGTSPSAGRERSPPTSRCSPASRPLPPGTRPSHLARGAPARGCAPGRRDHGRARRPAPADDGHPPRVASGPRSGSAAADRLTMVGRVLRRTGALGAQPRSLHLARPRHRRRQPDPDRRAWHRGTECPVLVRSDSVIRRATESSAP
jgi:hypothetical protein